MNQQMKEDLQRLAGITTLEENMGPDDCITDWCGGNFDDAYQMGLLDGEAILARELLAKYFKEQ